MSKPQQRIIKTLLKLNFNVIHNQTQISSSIAKPSIHHNVRMFSTNLSNGFANSAAKSSKTLLNPGFPSSISRPISSNGVLCPKIGYFKSFLGVYCRNYSAANAKLNGISANTLGFKKLVFNPLNIRQFSTKISGFGNAGKLNKNAAKKVVEKPLSAISSTFSRYKSVIALQNTPTTISNELNSLQTFIITPSMASPISIGAPQPWPSTSKTYNFCSQGCSFNCPQLCIFPPPPPLLLNPNIISSDDSDDSSSSRISPLMAALIAVLAAAFLLLFYFTVISKLCRRSRNRRRINRFLDSETSDPLSRVDSLIHDPTRPNSSASGLDDAFIRQITVFKYRREDNLVDGTECAVCLTEFNENENLRLMPNCEHAFHLPCIDTWLKTHSNCPLCRSTMNLGPPLRSSSGSVPPPPNPNPNPSSNTSTGGVNGAGVAALRVERRSNDAVLMIRELEGRVQVLETTQGDEVDTKLEINDDIITINNNTGNNNDNSR